jgi:hypothetical protein
VAVPQLVQDQEVVLVPLLLEVQGVVLLVLEVVQDMVLVLQQVAEDLQLQEPVQAVVLALPQLEVVELVSEIALA